jgi:tRNA1(Val) A37 N6-methylase TrmN6
MHYQEFDIDIETKNGVCPVGADTLMLARAAKDLSPRTSIDMGTGSGFIAVYLATLGATVTAVDQNELALISARENADRNGVVMTCILSDLFANVGGSFDLIVFNPPYGGTGHTALTPLLERIKSLIPRDSLLIARLTYPLIRRGRIKLIKRFIKEASVHAHEASRLLLCVHNSELNLISPYGPKIVGEASDMRAVIIEASSIVKI